MTTITSLRAASKLCGYSPATIAKWCAEFHLGTMVGEVWHINQDRLMSVAAIKSIQALAFKDAEAKLDKYRSI